MAAPRVSSIVMVVAVAAAWLAARSGGFGPALWLVLLVTCLALRPEDRTLIPTAWLAVGALLAGLSWLAALDHELAFRHTLLFAAAALVFGLARRSPLSDAELSGVAVAIALTGVLALSQASWAGEHVHLALSGLPAVYRELAAERLAVGRAFGTSSLPGHFAALLLMTAPFLVGRVGRSSGWWRVGWLSALALSATAIAMTRSLAVVLVAGVLFVLAALRLGRRRGLALAGVLVLAVAGGVLLARHDLTRLDPLQLRWVNWRTAAWVFWHHPWLGVGLGGVGQAGLVAPTAAGNITPYSHNTYLELTAELGVAGIGVVIAGVWSLVRLLRSGMRSDTALALAVAVLPLHNLIDFSAYAPEVLLPWAVLAGTLAGRTRPLPSRPVPGWLLLVVLGGGCVASALSWRSETTLAQSADAPPALAIELATNAASVAPWRVSPIEHATATAIASGSSPQVLRTLEAELSSRFWVRPASAGLAEARARLLLGQGCGGEALVWAREARRRAPWRSELATLEAACDRR
jgi:O-antigen ligase